MDMSFCPSLLCVETSFASVVQFAREPSPAKWLFGGQNCDQHRYRIRHMREAHEGLAPEFAAIGAIGAQRKSLCTVKSN
jgi:hypothetical protein